MASFPTLRVFLADRDVAADGAVIDAASFPARQGRLLFAYLVAEQGRPVPRDELAEALWGAAPPATWNKALSVLVSKLRGELSKHGVDGAVALTSAFGCYRLELPEGSWVDVVAAARAAREAEQALAAGDLAAAITAATLAASLTRQPFLPGEDGDWVEQKRRELNDVRRRALAALADAHLQAGDASQAARFAEQLIMLEPFRESGYRRLMQAHAAAGNRAEALRVYGRCRHLLADELGAYPSPETDAIYRELLDTPSARPDAVANRHAPSRAPSLTAPSRAGHAQPRHRRAAVAAGAVATVLAVAATLFLLTAARNDGGESALVHGDAVAIVDAAKARLVGAVAVDSRPAAITYGAGSIWVAYPDARAVARVSPTSRRVVASVPLDRPAQGLAASAGSVWAVGSNSTDTSLTLERIDPTFDTAARVRRLPMVATGDTGSIAVARDTVVVAPRSGFLTRIDARSGRMLARIDPTVSPTAVAQGFGSTWLAYREANVVVRIDASTGAITTIPVGHTPTALTVGQRAVWVTDALDGTVEPIDPATSSVVRTVTVGSEPSAIAEGDGSIWVANAGDGTLTRIDEETLEPTARVVVGGSPQALVVANGKVWVSVQSPPRAQPTGGTLVVSVPWDITAFDPAEADSFLDAPIESEICSTLLTYPDVRGPAGLRLVPDAARAAPTVSDGGRSYTFIIRAGLRFSPPSNEPVTAETFKHTIERSLSPRASGGGNTTPGQQALPDVVGAGAYIAGKSRHVAGITAHGDRLTIRLTHPAPDLPARLASTSAFCAVPSDMPPTPVNGRPFPSAGPYYIAAATPGRSLTLLRNPNYRGDRPRRPRRIEVVIGPQHPVQEVEASRLDYAIGGVPADQNARLERLYGAGSPAARRGRQQYFVNPMLEVDQIELNTSRPLFASARMRRAVNYAVDRRALAANGGTYYPHATAAQMYLPPGVPGFRDEHVYPLSPDLAKARRLAGAGRHTAVLYCWQGGGSPQAARIVASNLAAIGIDVRVHCWPGNQFWTRILTPHEHWDMAVDGYSGSSDPGDYLDSLASRSTVNVWHLHDRHLDALIRAAARQTGLVRAFAYARIDHELVRDVAPSIVFANESEHDFFSARVGCQVYAATGGFDLGTLCLRTGRAGDEITRLHS